MNHRTTYAVDVAKSVFEVAVSQHPGHVRERHRLSRDRFLTFFAQRDPATVFLEACGSAHHWARELQNLGHHAVLLPPHRVRPYVTTNKTDRADARALLEAARNQDIRPVPLKSIDQQSLAALHRLRSAWLAARTARINTVRGLLRELGIFIPLGAQRVRPAIAELLEDADSGVPQSLRPALADSATEISELERRIADLETQLNGLTPKEHSSGLTRRLGAISKHGDTYIRMLLIHGARSVLWSAKRKTNPDPIQLWALDLERLRGHNKAAVALANKLARIAWAVWKNQRPYERRSSTSLPPNTDC